MSTELIISIAIGVLLMIPAIVFHEVAHGYVAYLLGDNTARNQGRLSLNPIRHVDPFGTLLLPLILLVGSGGQMAFGYAKPVPVNTAAFANQRVGMFLTGIAGPATNLMMALAAGLAFRATGAMGEGVAAALLGYLLLRFSLLNLVLMFFNLIPLPPLDGSRVIPLFLDDRKMRIYHQLEQYGLVILIAAVFLLPQLTGLNPLGWYFGLTVTPLLNLFAGIS